MRRVIGGLIYDTEKSVEIAWQDVVIDASMRPPWYFVRESLWMMATSGAFFLMSHPMKNVKRFRKPAELIMDPDCEWTIAKALSE